MKKMLTDSKRLNIAIIISLILAIMNLIFGITYAILGTLMPYHQDFIGLTPSQISNYNPRLMFFIGVLIRMSGITMISTSITWLFILFYAFRKKEKWAWVNSLIGGLIGYTPMLFVTFTIVGPLHFVFWFTTISFILYMFALGISYKEFFS